MSDGWIALHRQIQEHWIWNEKPFSRGQAWVDLLLLANHADTKAIFHGNLVNCRRGTVNRSILSLAERWGWSRKKTRNFIGLLERNEMVTTEGTTQGTTITIVNYGFFQNVGPTKGPTKGPSEGQRRNTNNNDNNVNKDKERDREKHKHGLYGNVLLTDAELEKLKAEYPKDWQERIDRLSEYIESTGKKYKNHLATIRSWARRERRPETENERIDREQRQTYAGGAGVY